MALRIMVEWVAESGFSGTILTSTLNQLKKYLKIFQSCTEFLKKSLNMSNIQQMMEKALVNIPFFKENRFSILGSGRGSNTN